MFKRRCNMAMVELEPILQEDELLEQFGHQGGDLEFHGRVDTMHDMNGFDAQRIRMLIEKHHKYTGSRQAAEILSDWNRYLPRFVKVMPVDYRRALAQMQAPRKATERPGISVAVGM
jgi:glutamate synthase (NADPH/NADH) large chain